MKDKVIVTPVGKAIFPRLNKPDTMFIADGVYNVQLGLEKKDADKIQKEITDLVEEFAAGKPINKDQVEMKKDEETGLFILKAKTNAKFRTADGKMEDRKLAIFNKFNEPVDEFVRHGAKIALRLKLVPFRGRDGIGISRLITHVLLIENAERSDDDKGSLFGDLVEDRKDIELNPDL